MGRIPLSRNLIMDITGRDPFVFVDANKEIEITIWEDEISLKRGSIEVSAKYEGIYYEDSGEGVKLTFILTNRNGRITMIIDEEKTEIIGWCGEDFNLFMKVSDAIIDPYLIKGVAEKVEKAYAIA